MPIAMAHTTRASRNSVATLTKGHWVQAQRLTLPHTNDRAERGDHAGADEGTLVRAALADPSAFAPLYRRYRDRVYWYVYTRTANEDDAADLTQQVFTRALDALAQYQPRRGSFAAWLFGIARHALANFQGRRRPTITWDLLPGAKQPVAPDDPAAALLRHEDMARLRTLFDALEPDKRELLALRFVARLTAAEIAAVIGKSEAATQKQLSRTLHALAAHFEGV